MKKMLLAIIWLTGAYCACSQEDSTCLTPEMDSTEFMEQPWFDNNQYLENYLDSIGYPAGGGNRIVNNVKFWIPIKFWIYRYDDGTGGPTMREIRDLMDNLNRQFNQNNNTWIGFYMQCEPTFINNTSNMIVSFTAASLLMSTNQQSGCINVHVVDELRYAGGMALKQNNAIILNRVSYIQANSFTFAHEMGHVFGLVHTHRFWDWQSKCFKEAIDRNRTWPFPFYCGLTRIGKVCESTGDGLRDTPADPRLINNFSCSFTLLGQTDRWGDSYENPPNGQTEIPDTRNIMSYQGLDVCVDHFSRLQIGVMLWYLQRKKANIDYTYWQDTRFRFDDYEPDDEAITARTILLNEIQEHNFHQEYENVANSVPIITQCDQDWVRFDAPCNGNFTIQTSHISGWPVDANTRLTLYDANLNQLAQNDNISTTNLFSQIMWSFLANQSYFIRVENMNSGVTGYYNLEIDGVVLSGPSQFCGTQTFSMTQPAGTTVNWSVSPSGIVNMTSLPPNQVQLSQITGVNGEITLTGSFVHPCDGRLKQFTRTLFVGLRTPIFDLTPLGNGFCQNEWYEAIGSSIGNGTVSYNWRINGNLDNYHGYKIKRKFPANTTTISLTVYKAGCAESAPYTQTYVCGSARFSISPNPSGNNIKVKALGQATFSRVRIVDKMGSVKKDLQFPPDSKLVDINISSLLVDIYSVQVFDGSSWSALLLSVQR